MELHHAEALADQIDAPVIRDQPGEVVVCDAVNLDVEILWLDPEHRVANRSSDNDGPVPGGSQFAHNRRDRSREVDMHGPYSFIIACKICIDCRYRPSIQ